MIPGLVALGLLRSQVRFFPLFVLDTRIDTDGKLRAQLMREDIPLTPRLRMDLMGNSDLEYMAALRYVFDKSWAVRTHYDSDMGWGVGVAVMY